MTQPTSAAGPTTISTATRPGGADGEARPVALGLSLVIPAYNEQRRVEQTLSVALRYLAEQPYRAELLLVDDGSTDRTVALAQRVAATNPALRVITIPHGGKAAAVRAGMVAAGGAQIAFSDIDLATPLRYLDDLRRAAASGHEVAIASREGVGARRVGEPAYRHVMGRAFNTLVRLLVLPGIHDTQCGFKLFTREAATAILARARLYAEPGRQVAGPRVTAFDVELLVIARRLGYRIAEVPVVWTAGEQSKVNPATDTWHNFVDVLKVRLNDWRGHYR